MKLVYLDTFYLSACTEQGKWAIVYLSIRGVDFATKYDFSIEF